MRGKLAKKLRVMCSLKGVKKEYKVKTHQLNGSKTVIIVQHNWNMYKYYKRQFKNER